MSSPRLAIVCRLVQGLSGATGMVLEHARRLSGLGWTVDVIAEKLDREAVAAAGARPRRIIGWPWGSYLKRRVFAALADRAAARGGYDLVHGHGDGLCQDVLSLHNCVHAAHEAVHGAPLPPGSGVGRLHARLLSEAAFRLLVCNSRLMQEDVVRRFSVPRERTVVIHPGFDPARFNPDGRGRWREEARRELGLQESEVLFGLVTSGDFQKRGVAVFLAALGAVCRGNPAVRGLVVGKEARLEPYRRLAAEHGLSGKVSFLPPRPEVERYYHALDVYVHPARYEEFGMSVLEALACGLPVVVGGRVGAAELLGGELRDFVLGSPREGDRAGELAAKLQALAASPELRRRLGAAGPAAAAASTWERHFEAILACYRRLIKS